MNHYNKEKYFEEYFRKKLYGKSKHILFVQKHFPARYAVYEIIWKNMVESDRPQMAI